MTLTEVCIHNGTVADAALEAIKATLQDIGLSIDLTSECDAYEDLYDLAGRIQVKDSRETF